MDGYVIRWRGGLADKAEAILQMSMEPLTREDLLERIAEPRSAASLANALLADPRFKRTGVHHFGLAGWDHDEYTTISDEVAQEIARQGGEATVEHLVEYVSTTYGAAPVSVRAFAHSHRFVPTAHGTIRERIEGETTVATTSRPIAFTRSIFRGSTGWVLRLRVTDQTLRGSGTPIPPALARKIQVLPGERRVFTSEYGEVVVAWPSIVPTVSTVRGAVEGLDARPGDYLFVEFGNNDTVLFQVAHQSDLEALGGEARLAREVGLRLGVEGPLTVLIAEILGHERRPPSFPK